MVVSFFSLANSDVSHYLLLFTLDSISTVVEISSSNFCNSKKCSKKSLIMENYTGGGRNVCGNDEEGANEFMGCFYSQ